MHKSLDQIQHALTGLLNVLEKMLIFMAVLGFFCLQYLMYKLAHYLHKRCVNQKIGPTQMEMKENPKIVEKY